MAKNKENNFAFIDGANLDKGVKGLGWNIDYSKFRVWLRDKYNVQKAYIFLGLVPKYKDVYENLQEAGFTLIFKETTHDGEGNIKGNCDADLVLRAARDFYENKFDNAILVSSDGDYASLVKFLNEKDKFRVVLAPTNKCSILLKRLNVPISYINDQRSILEYRP